MIDTSNIEVHVSSEVTSRTFKRAAASGKVQFYRVRRNGTVRHMPYLAKGSTEREIAEQVQELRDRGTSIATIAETMEVSQPTVRRHLERLHFTQAIEKARAADLNEIIQNAVRD